MMNMSQMKATTKPMMPKKKKLPNAGAKPATPNDVMLAAMEKGIQRGLKRM